MQVLLSSDNRHLSKISFFHQQTFTWKEPGRKSAPPGDLQPVGGGA